MHTNPGPCICVGGGLRGRDAKGKQRKRRTIQEEGERGIRKYLIIRRQQRYTHLHVCSHPADQKYMSFKCNILPTPETRCTRTRLSYEPFVKIYLKTLRSCPHYHHHHVVTSPSLSLHSSPSPSPFTAPIVGSWRISTSLIANRYFFVFFFFLFYS